MLVRLYPEAPDLTGARERLRLFLVQYWGGPTTYSDERGHPRLRMRHMPFHIGGEERDRWLEHMSRAVDAATAELPDPDVAAEVATALLGYFNPAAESAPQRHRPAHHPERRGLTAAPARQLTSPEHAVGDVLRHVGDSDRPGSIRVAGALGQVAPNTPIPLPTGLARADVDPSVWSAASRTSYSDVPGARRSTGSLSA